MKFSFRVGGTATEVTRLESAVGVRLRKSVILEGNQAEATRSLGKRATDDLSGAKGVDLPGDEREYFEDAGWEFVEPNPEVREAASRAKSVEFAETTREVYLDANGRTLIGTDLVTLQVAEDYSAAQARKLLSKDGFREIRPLGVAANVFQARLPDRDHPLTAVSELQEQASKYQYVEPVLIERIGTRSQPSDPLYWRQWQFNNRDRPGRDINAEGAWQITKGKSDDDRPVRIAVIDNGFFVDHPDLQEGIVGGGYFRGAARGDATFVPYRRGRYFRRHVHGTFCAGLAGARHNNQHGGCGAAPESALILVACLKDQIGSQATLARAIAFAADPSSEPGSSNSAEGADVITCSLGPDRGSFPLSSVLKQAIDYAIEHGRNDRGTPVFWSVANRNSDISDDDHVCAYSNTIAVGQSNDRDEREEQSAFGDSLDLVAPGRSVFSTTMYGDFPYGSRSGTSYATPIAAGVAALVLSRNPALKWWEVRDRLRNTADKIGSVAYEDGRHKFFGYGRINAARAVQSIS